MDPIKQSVVSPESMKGALASDYPVWLVDGGAYGISGFALGFIVKRLGRLFFWAIALVMVLLILLHYSKGNIINIGLLQECFNEHAITSLDGLVHHVIATAQSNSVATASLFIGFIIGWYIG